MNFRFHVPRELGQYEGGAFEHVQAGLPPLCWARLLMQTGEYSSKASQSAHTHSLSPFLETNALQILE